MTISSKYVMYVCTLPFYKHSLSLSLAVFSSSKIENYLKNAVLKSAKFLGVIPVVSSLSSHLAALPAINACAISHIYSECAALESFIPTALKYLVS